ncbi:ribosome small subunit-dependent GTPase A [Sideroxydans lithotrophicus]|uniref:Small ribosomal subunit biogenesis GTPase RsgA n=1 Tax=Sideroxydans lithotrophicus (strain ES-1) TaxID=580332 RepID=D5CQP1_SIDLE|nr:ribosome small subunit-dependent GTPase A [Sideroxydans lithotrophicus]ADE11277.1 ribosome small subunit-dependent GTPase A [Sideroxydans lithotrophicus ES-1]
MSEKLRGQVIAAYGRHYLAELPGGEILECVPRGKKSEVACGDVVEVERTGTDQGVINGIAPRSTLLYRSDAYKQKLIAANVTQIIVVVATEPSFNDELLARCLLAAHEQKLETLIVLNKCDLPQIAAARAQLSPYGKIGYKVLELSAKKDVTSLLPFLQGHTSVLVGQSGMGKSTLVNALIPAAHAATREISTVLDSGKHTTTHARLYHLNADSHLIDCPGVQLFGLHHLDFAAMERSFPEFLPYLGSCRFANCSHSHEPDCAIRKATAEGKIDERRLKLFQQITAH